MSNSEAKQKDVAGLRNGAICLALGIVSILCVVFSGLLWDLLIVAAAPVALIGLFFGGIGLNSKGKWRALAISGVIVCFLVLIFAILARLGSWISDNPVY
jgi:hypothetical protein